MSAICTNPDCGTPTTDGFLCWPCTHLTHDILESIAFTRRRRGLGQVWDGTERDAVRLGVEGSNYRLDTLHEPPGAGPGLLEDLDVTIAHLDEIPYRPTPRSKPCREKGCPNLSDIGDLCSSCADYLPDARKKVALVPPSVKARDALMTALTTWARVLAEESGQPQVARAHEAAAETMRRWMMGIPSIELDPDPYTPPECWSRQAIKQMERDQARLDQTAATLARLTPPPMPHTIGWLAGSVRAIRAREWAGEMLTQIDELTRHASRVIDRPDSVVRIDCPRCSRKVPILPDAMTECRTCKADGTDEGWRMFGTAEWWADQVAPAGEPVEVDYLPIVMPRYGHHDLKLHTMRTWVDRDLVPVERIEKKPNGRTVRLVDPARVAEVAARMQARRRPVRAVSR